MLEESFALSEIDRKLHQLIRLGVVSDIDLTRARVRVKLGNNLTTWLPWVTHHAGEIRSWSPPIIGEQVVVLSPSGDMTQGVVLFALYQQKYPAPSDKSSEHKIEWEDGTLVSYDQASHDLHVTVANAGKITLQVGTAFLEITEAGIKLSAPKIELN